MCPALKSELFSKSDILIEIFIEGYLAQFELLKRGTN